MSNSHLDWIWSIYTTSPDPASGMSTLRDTCVALLNYPLTSSSFIPAIAGLALHPSVAEPFREVFPILKHLMYSAAQYHGTSQPLFDREHADFRLVTILGVRRDDAEAAWGRLLQKVADAMGYIEDLYASEEMEYDFGEVLPPAEVSAGSPAIRAPHHGGLRADRKDLGIVKVSIKNSEVGDDCMPFELRSSYAPYPALETGGRNVDDTATLAHMHAFVGYEVHGPMDRKSRCGQHSIAERVIHARTIPPMVHAPPSVTIEVPVTGAESLTSDNACPGSLATELTGAAKEQVVSRSGTKVEAARTELRNAACPLVGVSVEDVEDGELKSKSFPQFLSASYAGKLTKTASTSGRRRDTPSSAPKSPARHAKVVPTPAPKMDAPTHAYAHSEHRRQQDLTNVEHACVVHLALTTLEAGGPRESPEVSNVETFSAEDETSRKETSLPNGGKEPITNEVSVSKGNEQNERMRLDHSPPNESCPPSVKAESVLTASAAHSDTGALRNTTPCVDSAKSEIEVLEAESIQLLNDGWNDWPLTAEHLSGLPGPSDNCKTWAAFA
ncbi:hypothetical protein B0H11DRAFT_1937915 [Mycena galericulata]|nr:hypothetical protein B0H11DRAFT_1937915 [Mycena galericulata]